MTSDGMGEKIDTLLAEFRIMVPALGAIFGFQLVVAFQPAFADLSATARVAEFAGMVCTVLALVFLLVPASFHRFTPEMDESVAFLRFAQRNVSIAFIFLPLSLALSLYTQAVQIFKSEVGALAVGLGVLAIAGIEWWIIPWRKARHSIK